MSKQHSTMQRRVRICGPKGCRNVDALIDTGASHVTMASPLAKLLGIVDTGDRGTIHTANGPVKAYAGRVKLCMTDKGCGCLDGPAVVLPTKSFGDGNQLLVGQDYLEASRAIIDAASRSIRCRRR